MKGEDYGRGRECMIRLKFFVLLGFVRLLKNWRVIFLSCFFCVVLNFFVKKCKGGYDKLGRK